MEEAPSAENYEKFVELFTSHEQGLRTFVRSLGLNWHDADEIVQEVALVALRKFAEFEQGTSFLKWVCVIARFKTLSFRRKMARERLAFNTELLELMADEAVDESEIRSQEYQALEGCLEKLPEKQRRWVTLAYTQGTSARDEAARLGVKEGAFYMRLNRIRASLLDCIQKSLKESPA
tara:strand:- start:787 stop:1320 length:534 start_codon:yes stop_codon:yes gene_type:complete